MPFALWRRLTAACLQEAEAQRNRTSKAMKALRVELAAMKEEAQRQRTEIAALRARAADTSLATKVAAMQDELTAVREDNRVLRQSVDTTVGGLREQVGAVAAETSELRHQTAELARLGAEVESLKEHVKEEQRHNAVRPRRALEPVFRKATVLMAVLVAGRAWRHCIMCGWSSETAHGYHRCAVVAGVTVSCVATLGGCGSRLTTLPI